MVPEYTSVINGLLLDIVSWLLVKKKPHTIL